MPIVWPAELPQLPSYGWIDAKFDNTVRTETDSGPAKVRRRYTKANRKLTLPILLTAAEVATLETFHTATLVDGSLRFEMEHPRTGLTYEFRFLEPYEVTEIAEGLFQTSLALEYLP